MLSRDALQALYPDTWQKPARKRVHWMSSWNPTFGEVGPNKVPRNTRSAQASSGMRREHGESAQDFTRRLERHQRRIRLNVGNDVSAVHSTTMTQEDLKESLQEHTGWRKAPTQVSGNKKSAALNDPARLSDDDDDMEVDGVERAGSNEAGPCPPH